VSFDHLAIEAISEHGEPAEMFVALSSVSVTIYSSTSCTTTYVIFVRNTSYAVTVSVQ